MFNSINLLFIRALHVTPKLSPSLTLFSFFLIKHKLFSLYFLHPLKIISLPYSLFRTWSDGSILAESTSSCNVTALFFLFGGSTIVSRPNSIWLVLFTVIVRYICFIFLFFVTKLVLINSFLLTRYIHKRNSHHII